MKKANIGKATRIKLFSLEAPHMRTFHLSWMAFFLCFFGWFGIAPLMAVVRNELGLSQAQVGNIIIASVFITIFARLLIGWMCDKVGPRLTYSGLLIFGSLPVMMIGLSNSYESFLICRLMIGVIGASFVITQYHTSVMFAHNVVGTANATTAGWGNMGGGVTQMVMPLIFASFVFLGFSDGQAWRWAMVVPGVAMVIVGILYIKYTTDCPQGNFKDIRKKDPDFLRASGKSGGFMDAVKDYRVWALFLIYGACFGIELTINNIAAIYFYDYFDLSLRSAGLIAGLFGFMNIFARSMGGYFGDRFGIKYGLKGRVKFLFVVLIFSGFALMLFSRMTILPVAIGTMILFSLFVQMSEGATYSVVPFVNKRAIGAVSGIVGAGGNAGAVAAGFLFRYETIPYGDALFILGCIVVVCSFAAFFVRFNARDEVAARQEMAISIQEDLDYEESLKDMDLQPVPVRTNNP